MTPNERTTIATSCRAAIDAIERELPGELWTVRKHLAISAHIADGLYFSEAEATAEKETQQG